MRLLRHDAETGTMLLEYDPAELRWRFDALTGVLGLDRERARAWTLGRVLQNCLWEIEDGEPLEREQVEMGGAVRSWTL